MSHITSKSCWMQSMCGKYTNPTRSCECRTDDVFCIRLFKINKLMDLALLTEAQKTAQAPIIGNEFDIDAQAYSTLQWYKDNITTSVEKGVNMFIHSNICGNGKTYWSVEMIKSYIYKIWTKSPLECRALFIEVPKFFYSLKANIESKNEYANYILENITTADLVVWDEIGIKDLTDYEHEYLLSIVNDRLNAGKANIFTSNLNKDSLIISVGERLFSRIWNTSYDVELFGPDRRLPNT